MGNFGGNCYPTDRPVLEDERSWAMAAHLSVMAGSVVPFGNVLGPLAVWLFGKSKGEFVAKHAREALMFQIGLVVAAIGLVVLFVATGGRAWFVVIPGVLLLVAADLGYMVLATVRANQGLIWEYPVTTRWVG